MRVEVIVRAIMPARIQFNDPAVANVMILDHNPIPKEQQYAWIVETPYGSFGQSVDFLSREGVYVWAAQVESQWPSVNTDIWFPFHQVTRVRPI